jgi:hypothetical protein
MQAGCYDNDQVTVAYTLLANIRIIEAHLDLRSEQSGDPQLR